MTENILLKGDYVLLKLISMSHPGPNPLCRDHPWGRADSHNKSSLKELYNVSLGPFAEFCMRDVNWFLPRMS